MFIQNKYFKCYYSIVNQAKSRTSPEKFEKHHIIPKSLGGDNSDNNLVNLTLREHFICHLLLTRMTRGNDKTKMFYAVWRMCNSKKNDYKVTSRTYEHAKITRSKILSENAGPTHYNSGRRTGRTSETFTDSWKDNISKSKCGKLSGKNNPMYGKIHTAESKKKLSETRKRKAIDPMWNIRPPCSDETALKIKLANQGKRWVHNKATKERKYVDPNLVADYINIGWEIGLGPKTVN